MDIEVSAIAARRESMVLLGIDTCGPSGSVALGCLTGMLAVRTLAQKELEGRTYSATLVSAVRDLLGGAGISLAQVGCIVVVNGPGSFTGVRVGLSAVKGLGEPAQIPVVAVSRLEVLATKARVLSAALDAHRKEVFLRWAGPDLQVRELLAGAGELATLDPPSRIAVCDPGAMEIIARAWPDTMQVQTPAPTAIDALMLAAPDISAGEFVDLSVLDGHYLRRSDAEIFGPQPARSL